MSSRNRRYRLLQYHHYGDLLDFLQRRNGRGAGGGGPDDPLIAALIQKLPPAGTDWSTDERVAWLQLMIMGFQVAYGPKDQISVKKEAAN